MLAPRIHLGGSLPEHLTEAVSTALAAMRAAREALQGVAPNGRDYVGIVGGLGRAIEDWQRMDAHVARVEDELIALAEEICRAREEANR